MIRLGIIDISLTEGKTDDKSLEAVMNSNLYNVFFGLNQKAKEYQDYQEKIENHGRHQQLYRVFPKDYFRAQRNLGILYDGHQRDPRWFALNGQISPMIWENLSGSYMASNLDNPLEVINGGFLIIDHLPKPDDFQGEVVIIDRMKQIGHQVIARMLHDHLKCEPLARRRFRGLISIL